MSSRLSRASLFPFGAFESLFKAWYVSAVLSECQNNLALAVSLVLGVVCPESGAEDLGEDGVFEQYLELQITRAVNNVLWKCCFIDCCAPVTDVGFLLGCVYACWPNYGACGLRYGAAFASNPRPIARMCLYPQERGNSKGGSCCCRMVTSPWPGNLEMVQPTTLYRYRVLLI